MSMPAILILGGTGEARLLAEQLCARGDLDVTLSLAGRTKSPLPQAGRVRVGGFGGAEGLAAFLRENGIAVLVDATHPYAARISVNAVAASSLACLPLVVLERAPWQPVEGDRWIDASSVEDAAGLLGKRRNVFLAIGRQELAPFRAHPQHRYIVRSVDPVGSDQAIAGAVYLLERGPFDINAERALLVEQDVDIVVSKNSGAPAAYGKIAAARQLGLPVVMIARPRSRPVDAVSTVDEAVRRILHCAGLPA